MKTKYFLKKHEACCDGARWALSIGKEMADVWEAMIAEEKHAWLIWTATRPDVFPSSTLRKLACRFVRETPLPDGRKVWDLLADERSRKAVEVAEAYADGKATESELYAAHYAACVAAGAAESASWVAAASCAAADYFAFCASVAAHAVAAAADAAADAARATYSAAESARSAQVRMIAELGNPFKEESESC